MLLGAGCATQRSPAPKSPPSPASKPSETVVTPDFRPVGRVAMVNLEARFVVLSFPYGAMPQPGAHLSIEHRGLKIGDVKITGPQRDDNTVGDLVDGEANVGDEAKSE
jgi:hypothetical protein